MPLDYSFTFYIEWLVRNRMNGGIHGDNGSEYFSLGDWIMRTFVVSLFHIFILSCHVSSVCT